jgi:hypothetical protein
MSLVQVAQGDKLFRDATSKLVFRQLGWVCEDTRSDGFMGLQELIDVVHTYLK